MRKIFYPPAFWGFLCRFRLGAGSGDLAAAGGGPPEVVLALDLDLSEIETKGAADAVRAREMFRPRLIGSTPMLLAPILELGMLASCELPLEIDRPRIWLEFLAVFVGWVMAGSLCSRFEAFGLSEAARTPKAAFWSLMFFNFLLSFFLERTAKYCSPVLDFVNAFFVGFVGLSDTAVEAPPPSGTKCWIGAGLAGIFGGLAGEGV